MTYSNKFVAVFLIILLFCSGCSARRKALRKMRRNPYRVEMILVPGTGGFLAFNMAKYEISQGQWQKVMGNNPSYFKKHFLKRFEYPVEMVSWEDAQQFVEKLNERSGFKYRLPYDWEWEHVARGGLDSKGYQYAGSNRINEVAWHGGNSKNTTHPAGSKKPNELGIYDMSGNVWEWCIHEDESGDYGVPRGGGWYNGEESCRVDFRAEAGGDDDRFYSIGLRLVLISYADDDSSAKGKKAGKKEKRRKSKAASRREWRRSGSDRKSRWL